MDEERIKKELRELSKVCERVHTNLHEGWVVLKGYEYPTGWEPQTSHFRLDLPDAYPSGGVPKPSIPNEMRYEGDRPGTMRRESPDTRPELGGIEWTNYCIRNLRKQWNNERQTTVTMVRMVNASLEDPYSKNPLG